MDAPLDARSQEIFDSVPPDEPRSCLEPYKALILRLHNRGRTYRRIQQILAEKCGVTVAYSTLYEFVHRRYPAEIHPGRR
jgi:transposase